MRRGRHPAAFVSFAAFAFSLSLSFALSFARRILTAIVVASAWAHADFVATPHAAFHALGTAEVVAALVQAVLAERFLVVGRALAGLGGQWKQASARLLANVATNAFAAFEVIGALGVVVAFVLDFGTKKDTIQIERTLAGLDHFLHGKSDANGAIATGRTAFLAAQTAVIRTAAPLAEVPVLVALRIVVVLRFLVPLRRLGAATSEVGALSVVVAVEVARVLGEMKTQLAQVVSILLELVDIYGRANAWFEGPGK